MDEPAEDIEQRLDAAQGAEPEAGRARRVGAEPVGEAGKKKVVGQVRPALQMILGELGELGGGGEAGKGVRRG